jgi:sulfur-carrier protein
MALKILYFAHLRETIGTGTEQINLPPGIATVADLRAHLAGTDAAHAALMTTKNLRAAVNQKMAGMEAAVADGDEIAFFPPVTGG